MIYKPFKDIRLSRLGMGNMRLPVDATREGSPIDRVKAQKIIDYAMANGINYYDTAYVYHHGESEKFLGDALAKYDRKSYYLATKYTRSANHDYKAFFEEQLAHLKTDYVDFYLMHSVTDDNYNDYMECGCIEYFEEQQKAGRIKYLGFSSHSSPEVLRKFASLRDWDFTQIQLNYYDWCFGSAKEEYEILAEAGIPVMVMEPVRGGRLAELSEDAGAILKAAHPEKSIPSWAFDFVRSLPAVQVVLSGMSTLDQIKENIATFSEPDTMTDQDRQTLFRACEAFRREVQVPCTACRYCCDDCPAHINIPEVLRIYNNYRTDGRYALYDIRNIKTTGLPTDCISCGSCASHCPQNIDIPDIMSRFAQMMKEMKI